jgi:hypothetical protein
VPEIAEREAVARSVRRWHLLRASLRCASCAFCRSSRRFASRQTAEREVAKLRLRDTLSRPSLHGSGFVAFYGDEILATGPS